MRSKALKRVLAALVVLVFAFPMMISLSGFQTYASSVRKTRGLDYGSRFDLLQVPADRVVRAIVLLDDKSLTEQNYNVRTTSMSHSAVNAQQKLLAKQNSIAAKMTSGFDVSVLYNYTVLLNGMAIETTYGNLKDIEAMDGVSGVYLANTYSVPDVQEVPMTECANEMVNLGNLHNSGYDGDGIVIAVLDTGLNVEHEAVKDYGNIDNVVLTQNSINNADTLKKGVYVSEKIPFVYDYADDDTDVTDTDGHGTHVTGIAAGYVQESDGAVTFSGSAPAAQVLNMKIFSSKEDAHGTDSAIYFAALEDAYLLGADVINMSIGAEAGFAYDTELEDKVFGNIYKKLEDAGIVVCVSAGNEYSKAYNNLNWLSQYAGVESVISSYTDYGNIATPSVYDGNLSVASAENLVFPAEAIRVGETVLQVTDSCTDGVHDFIDTFGGETLEFVMVPNAGSPADYEGLDVEGKIAVISRGDITFEEKVENAANAKAIGAVVYNNEEGAISMAIETFEIPAVSVEMTAKDAFNAAADGTFFVYDGMVKVDNVNAGLMSDFSCWGPTPELTFKPEITGIGGNVYSADATTNDGYIVYSGTSMASPNVAGTMACLLQAIYATTSVESKKEAAQLIEALAQSTAYVLSDDEGYEYSPRKQGAGLIDASNALAAEAYIVNPVMSLGDDPNRTGSYDVEFTLKRRASGTLKYSIKDSILFDFVEEYTEDEDGLEGKYNYICSDYFRDHDDSWITITSNFANNEVILADGVDEVDVKVNVKLSSDAMAYLDKMFENGTYVEGFIYLENADLVELHASFMAYYGNWCDAPILDRYDFRDLINATTDLNTVDIDGNGTTLADYGYTVYDLLEASLGFNEAYICNLTFGMLFGYLGDNLSYYYYHDDGRNAISTELTDADSYLADAVVAYPSMLRNARHIIMTVTDVNTNEVYYVDDTEYARKDIYDEDYESYFQTTTFIWDGTDADGNYVPNGTKVMITFDAQLAYEGAELQKDIWSFPLTVDYQAPKAQYSWDATTKKLTVKMSDNECLQSIAGYSEDIYEIMDNLTDEEYENFNAYDYLVFDEGYEDIVSETTSVYDLSEYKGDKLFIELYDYATNGTTFEILDLSKSQGNITYTVNVPVSDQFTVVSSTPNTGIENGGSFTFTVNNSNGAQTEEFEVYANDKLLTPVDGVYTVSDITSDVSLTLKDVTAPEATLTINGDKTSSDVVTDVDFSFVTNEDVTYSITAEDLGSGIAGLYYMVSDKQLSQEELASSEEWKDYSTAGAIIKDGQYIVYAKAVDAAGNTTYVSSNGIEIDKTAPELNLGGIDLGATIVTVSGVNSDASFTVDTNTDVVIEINPENFGKDVKEVEYIISDKALTEAELISADWQKPEDGKVTLSDDGDVIVYFKALDEAGNASYAMSNGIVVDKTAPVIKGIENNKEYNSTVEFTVEDANLASVTINGKEADVTASKYSLQPADGVQTIVATDKAGNKTTYKVTVNKKAEDKDAPVIKGIENNGTYYGEVEFTVTDESAVSVIINQKPATAQDGVYKLQPADGTQTVIATDAAGNMTIYTVTVKPAQNNGDSNNNGAQSDKNNTVNTGDTSTAVNLMFIALASGLIVILLSKKRKEA